MRFKNRHPGSQIPEVNLVPMMDVLMTVLTFFVILSMTLTGQRLLNIDLPGVGTSGQAQGEDRPKQQPLEVGLTRQGEIVFKNQVITKEQLASEMQAYLAENPEGNVVLKADRELSYQVVTAVLRDMGKVGGDRLPGGSENHRVSLAIEPTSRN